MENRKENKKLKYFYQDDKFLGEKINSINHTNINNNINITNYYPPPSHDYSNKEAFTFINDNGNDQNLMRYPIKTVTHKTKKTKDSSPNPSKEDNKYHKCQSPYMKKILPSSKRQKSEEANRITNIYKNSPSYKYLKTNKDYNKDYHNNGNKRKKDPLNIIENNQNFTENYYLGISSDEITIKEGL